LALQPRITFKIMQLRIRQIVPRTVDFDHKRTSVTGEINDIATNRGLPPDAQVEPSQFFPEQLLRQGHRLAEVTRATDRARSMTTGHVKPPFPLDGGRVGDGGAHAVGDEETA
jgi:hypothetical protein